MFYHNLKNSTEHSKSLSHRNLEVPCARGGFWGVGRSRQTGPVWSLASGRPRSALTLWGHREEVHRGISVVLFPQPHCKATFSGKGMERNITVWWSLLRPGAGITAGNVEVTSWGKCVWSGQWPAREYCILLVVGASNVASPQSFPSPPGGDKGAKEQEAPGKPQHPERGSGTSTSTCSQEGVGARPSSSQGRKVVASKRWESLERQI